MKLLKMRKIMGVDNCGIMQLCNSWIAQLRFVALVLVSICVAFISIEADAAVWTGNAGNGSMKDGDNWQGGTAPASGDALDFSAVTSATTLAADFEDSREFGAVTMGTGIITFTGSLAATSFSDTTKLAIGVDSTVTIDGDLSLSGNSTHYICYQM